MVFYNNFNFPIIPLDDSARFISGPCSAVTAFGFVGADNPPVSWATTSVAKDADASPKLRGLHRKPWNCYGLGVSIRQHGSAFFVSPQQRAYNHRVVTCDKDSHSLRRAW